MEARRSTLGVAVLNNCIYAVGGFDGSTGLSSAEKYDPTTQEWRMIASMSTRRSSVGVCVLNGLVIKVYIHIKNKCEFLTIIYFSSTLWVVMMAPHDNVYRLSNLIIH